MNLKALLEKRSKLIEAMKALVEKTTAESRAFDDTEKADYEAKKNEVTALDDTIRAIREQENFTDTQTNGDTSDTEQQEERAFAEYIRSGKIETRADVNMTATDNGAVIPTSIANKIIRKIEDICPIFSLATRYNVGGTLNIPYYDEETTAITMAYATEFSDLESTSGKFLSVELKGFLAGALSKVSKSLANNSNFDIVNYVVGEVAYAASKWIEKELLNGTNDKITGLSTVSQTVTAVSTSAITADELIDLQEKIPDAYQGNAIWIMSKSTRTAIRKLKDSDGQYLLNKDATAKWGYTLFGKPVYVSANVSAIAAGKAVVYYGDMSGLAVKVSEDVNIEILREKFATQHAIGVIAWLEMDSKIENQQKLAVLKMKAGT